MELERKLREKFKPPQKKKSTEQAIEKKIKAAGAGAGRGGKRAQRKVESSTEKTINRESNQGDMGRGSSCCARGTEAVPAACARACGNLSELCVRTLLFVDMQLHASLQNLCVRKENMRKKWKTELICGRAEFAVRVEGVRVKGGGHLKLDAGVKERVHDHVCSRTRLFATTCMCWNLRARIVGFRPS